MNLIALMFASLSNLFSELTMKQKKHQVSENSLNLVMAPTPKIVDSKTISLITEDGSMDRRGNPAVKANTGKWRSSILLLGKIISRYNYSILLSWTLFLSNHYE